jgi:hypothetical protein
VGAVLAVPLSHAIQIGYGPPEVMEWRAAAVAGGPGHAGLPLPAAAEAHHRQERGDLADRALWRRSMPIQARE